MINVVGINFTILEVVSIAAVVYLLIDNIFRSVDRRRLNELEKKVRDQAVTDRVYNTSHADLIKRANDRTFKIPRNNGPGEGNPKG